MSQPSRLLTFIPRPSSWSTPHLLWTAASFITLVSLWRLVHLDHLLVWHDEVYSIIRVLGYSIEDVFNSIFVGQLLTPEQLLRFQYPDGAHGWADTWQALIGHPEHGPLYYVLGRLSLVFPLEPVIGLRGIAALMSALLPLAVFWFMRELFGRTDRNWPVAWVAAGLIAVSPLYVLYAHEARQYTLWLLLLVSSSAALLHVLRTPQRRWWWLYGVLMTLSFYTHLLSALTVIIHAGYGLLHLYYHRATPTQSPRIIIRSWLLTLVIATLLFTPWLGVMVYHRELLSGYTSWMTTTVSLSAIWYAWGAHIVRAFIDINPALPTWSLLLLLPIAAAVVIYVRRAPRPAVWLLPAFALCFIGIVLVPDLLSGGMRSLQLRYALPAVLAMQCMIAWVIGTALIPVASTTATVLFTPQRARVALTVLVSMGMISLVMIDRSPTWWSKNYSENNYHIAQLINAQPAALLFVSNSAGVTVGEAISTAYYLNPDVRIWGEPMTGVTADVLLPTTNGERFALLPWTTLIAAFAPDQVTLIDGSWQWFRVESPVSEPQLISSANEKLAPSDIALPTEQLPNQTPPSIAE